MHDARIVDLSKKYGTPLYLLDYDSLNLRVSEMIRMTPENAQLCYAIKANPFLVKTLTPTGILFEACSPGEFAICRELSVPPKQIVFSGVYKSRQDVRSAYEHRLHTITLESLTQCRYLIDTIRQSPDVHEQMVIVRLTSGNQFGMSANDVREAVRALKDIPSVRLRGIHYFTGTQKKWAQVETELAFITGFCDSLKTDLGVDIPEIEYGPGLAVDYFSGSPSENLEEYERLCELLRKSQYRFVIEAGRYIAASSGTYATRIVDIKSDDDQRYCIIDGGINHITYFGQILGMKVPTVRHIAPRSAASGAAEKDYCICGSLCTTADVVIRKLPLRDPQLDDILVFENIGAYSITEGIYLFLSHALPIVLGTTGDKDLLLRDSIETYTINFQGKGD